MDDQIVYVLTFQNPNLHSYTETALQLPCGMGIPSRYDTDNLKSCLSVLIRFEIRDVKCMQKIGT